ncbi:hypothetical protein, partial [Stutzerimonas stutzeri]|uniref:hypothetical protein n=1 Tax=Stutzerimonas stutzeri TaxID=316 RepID=UPI001BD58F25
MPASTDNLNSKGGDLLGIPVGGRQGAAHGLAQLGLFCLPALVLTVPINLLPYGLLLLLSTLLAPELLWRARGMAGQPVKVLTWLMLAVLV